MSEYNLILKALLNKNSNPKLGLDRISKLLDLLSFNNIWYKTVQIVGTNGKGSTAAFLENILLKQNLRVGKFISPHLTTARERFVINGQMISEEDFVKAAKHIFSLALQIDEEPSFFECVLGMAVFIFKEYNVDVVILEAGLGGRLDATTACKADVLGITTIDLDHQSILGESLEAITKEKLGAARKDQHVIVAHGQKKEVKKEIYEAKNKMGFHFKESDLCSWPLGLLGDHQSINAGLAISLADSLGYLPKESLLKDALLNTFWPGRIEIFHRSCPIVLDGAHNESGIVSLAKALNNDPRFSSKPCVLIFGATRGHDVDNMIKTLLLGLKNICQVFVYQSQNARAFLKEDLFHLFQRHVPVSNFKNLLECENLAYDKNGYLLVCGSLYALGEIRSKLSLMTVDNLRPNF